MKKGEDQKKENDIYHISPTFISFPPQKKEEKHLDAMFAAIWFVRFWQLATAFLRTDFFQSLFIPSTEAGENP